jgi:hypothetical protein
LLIEGPWALAVAPDAALSAYLDDPRVPISNARVE